MTEDGNPFTKELGELFASLVVTLPLNAHRVRFTKVEETFTSEEAIINLGSLKSSQSHRMPDPKDHARWVITTAITTFTMPKEMARSVCQRFLDARFIESADGKLEKVFSSKGGVWQLTPKGINIVHRWCTRIGVSSRQLDPILRRDNMHLVVLEREEVTDKLSQDKSTIEVIFRRFAGQDGPNLKSSTSVSDSDSINDYSTGLMGVKMAKERQVSNQVIANTFTGKAASDWLLDCCTTIDRRETYMLAELFIKHKLMWAVAEDTLFMRQNPSATIYQPTKNAIYALTGRGQQLCAWPDRTPRMSGTDNGKAVKKEAWANKDSNRNRLNMILHDPALRLLFREFLRQSLCEENLTFYQDVKEFTSNYHNLEHTGGLDKLDAVQEIFAAAYGKASLNLGRTCTKVLQHCTMRFLPPTLLVSSTSTTHFAQTYLFAWCGRLATTILGSGISQRLSSFSRRHSCLFTSSCQAYVNSETRLSNLLLTSCRTRCPNSCGIPAIRPC